MGLPPGTYRILRGHPHPSGLTASHLPPRRGKALRAADSRPYGGKRARSVGWETQAQFLNRTSGKFPPTQGPSGPGRKRWQAFLALRAGRVLIRLRSGPRNGGPGVRRLGAPFRCSSGAVPRRSFGDFPIAGKVTRRRSGEIPRRKLKQKSDAPADNPPPPFSGIQAPEAL